METTEIFPGTAPPSTETDDNRIEGATARTIVNVIIIIFGTLGNSLILRVLLEVHSQE